MVNNTSYHYIEVSEFGGPEVLKLRVEDSLPLPKRGEVRVKVLTAGTGFTDTIVRQGQYYGIKDKPPFIPGYDWFGVVDALGEGVTDFKLGQYVADMPVIGGYSQYLCVSADSLIAAPDGLDPSAAVAMILSYTTAYQMLTRIRELPAGSTCLVHAAAGAVGTGLLELGRLQGLKMYGTASKAKHDTVRALGAEPIDYRADDFVSEIERLTAGEGVDVVFDTIGGRNWSRSYRCLKRGGLLIGFGALQLTTGEEKVPSLLWGFFKLLLGWRMIPNGKESQFYNIQNRRKKHPQEFKEDVSHLFALLKQGLLQPKIDAIVDLDQAQAVHKRIDSAEITGKVVLRCNPY